MCIRHRRHRCRLAQIICSYGERVGNRIDRVASGAPVAYFANRASHIDIDIHIHDVEYTTHCARTRRAHEHDALNLMVLTLRPCDPRQHERHHRTHRAWCLRTLCSGIDIRRGNASSTRTNAAECGATLFWNTTRKPLSKLRCTRMFCWPNAPASGLTRSLTRF